MQRPQYNNIKQNPFRRSRHDSVNEGLIFMITIKHGRTVHYVCARSSVLYARVD